MTKPVTIKGNGNKLEFWMDGDLSFSELREALINRLDVNASFYISSNRPVVFFGKAFTEEQKKDFIELLENEYRFYDISFFENKVDSDIPNKHSNKTVEPDKPAAPVSPEKSEHIKAENEIQLHDVFINKTLRSGQKIQCSGNVTIIGDVNSGAEIIAGGNVAIFGRLSGMVHAGAYGDISATIAANRLTASQVRIGGKIAVLPSNHKPKSSEIVKFSDGKIVISSIN